MTTIVITADEAWAAYLDTVDKLEMARNEVTATCKIYNDIIAANKALITNTTAALTANL